MRSLFIFIVFFASCATQDEVNQRKEIKVIREKSAKAIKDSIVKSKNIYPIQKKINDTVTMDDFPVTDDMLNENDGELQIDSIISFDKAWFYNAELDQTLVFELYTDYHRMYTYLFSTKYIEQIKSDLTLHRFKKNTIYTSNQNEIKSYIPLFARRGQQIKKKYFISNKGIAIGDKIQKAIKTYGAPDSTYRNKKITNYIWKYHGEYDNWNETVRQRRIARNSYGYKIIIYTLNDKIIAVCLVKEIP